ncbi:MAG: family 16 glycoside hydrolase, partial [Planctomycetota bacterium]
SASAGDKVPTDHHPSTDAYPGWNLGVQAWTFKKYTLFEAIDKTASLGLDWIEAYPGQKVGGPYPDTEFKPGVSKEVRMAVKKKLKQAGLRLSNFGVVGLPNDEEKCRKVFEFAEDMGVRTIVSEPPMEAIDTISELCGEYEIPVAIHNHPKPSPYWNPEKVLEASQGRKWIGACVDPGHWERSGVDPVEGLKKLEGNIKTLHLKDVVDGEDVVWGTGDKTIKAVLKELDRQGFEGPLSIEYETNWTSQMPDLRRCIDYYEKVARGMKDGGFKTLLGKNLDNWIQPGDNWELNDRRVLMADGGHGNIWTEDEYHNFVFDLEFKLAEDTNSGVFLRTGDIENWLNSCIEVQILDTAHKDEVGSHDCGAIFDCLAPSANPVREPGKWNHYTITCRNNMIYVVLNGTQVIEMNLNRWDEAGKNPDGSSNKFKHALKDFPRTGRLGVQYHGHPIWFRNVKVKELD